MARRKQKFSILHIILMTAALIWLPTLVERMAGIPPAPDPEDPKTSTEIESPLEVVPVVDSTTGQNSDSQENAASIKPAPAALRLTETLLSGSGKTAIINGRAFRENEMLTSLGYPYRVRSIFANTVILEGDGSLLELRRKSVFD